VTDFYVGGYSPDAGGQATGISRARSYPDGTFELLGVAAEVESPSWLIAAGGIVHAALEASSQLASFRVTAHGLELLSKVPAGGQYPCHLGISGGALLAACYGDGVVAVHELDERGAIVGLRQAIPGAGSGPLEAQEGPHAHTVHPLADGRVLSVDLGADRLHVHEWQGELLVRIDTVALPPGTGPRDLLMLPGGALALLGEWSCELLMLEPVGDAFEVGQILTLPGATVGTDQAAALALSDDGRHLYAGIRGADRVAIVALDPDGARGAGWVPSGGEWPRHLVVDGELLHVANQRTSSVATFRIAADGSLGQLSTAQIASPTHLLAVAGGGQEHS
jgi:6-phosphogluconolactonase (cycloisomerase 2 family)